MSINCDKCSKLLVEPGALVFSPPDGESRTVKIHLCAGCYSRLVDWITRRPTSTEDPTDAD